MNSLTCSNEELEIIPDVFGNQAYMKIHLLKEPLEQVL